MSPQLWGEPGEALVERLELRNGCVVDNRHAVAVKAPGCTPVAAVADVAMDAACERVLIDRCRPAAGVVARCRVGVHAGGSSAFAKVADPRCSPALLSAAASVVPKDLTRKHQQILDARGDAVMVPAFDSVAGVF